MTDASTPVLQPGPRSQDAEPFGLCLTRLFLPCAGGILTADSSPENRAWLAARFRARTIHTVSRSCLLAALRRRFQSVLLDEAVFGLQRRSPELSASRVMTPGQASVAILLVLTAALLLWLDASLLMRILLAFLSLAFVGSGLFRTALAFLGTAPRREPPLPADSALPLYTILVPLYREAAVLPDLAAAMRALDYPDMLAQAPQEI